MPTGLRNPMSPTRNRLSLLAKRTGDRDCQTHSKCCSKCCARTLLSVDFRMYLQDPVHLSRWQYGVRTRSRTSFPPGEASRNSLPGEEPTLSQLFLFLDSA